MAGKKRISSGASPVLNSEYWATFGYDEEPSPRLKLLLVTMGEISRRGILDVNAHAVCELVGVKPPMVNYYFGSFDGLLAEAVAQTYEYWLAWTNRSISRRAGTPEQRLRNFLEGEIERSRSFGAMVVFSAYPSLSESVTAELDAKHTARMESIFEYTLAVVATLIHDLKTGAQTPITFTVDDYPAASYRVSRVKELLAAASVMWSISGLSLWATGQHGATSRIGDLPGALARKKAMKAHVNRIVESLQREF